jgi:hypothetical protein
MVNDYQQNNQVHYNQWGAVNAGLMQNINTCDYLSTQNALLYNVAASACIEIDNLTNRLNSVMNTDVLRNEWLSEGKEGLLYNVKKNSDIKDEIESTADSPVIIDARGCDFGNYKPKVNLECVKDMVAFDGYIEIGGTRMGIQAPVIILSNELGYTLDPELFFEIEICSDDINAKIVETLYKYKEQLGDLIVEFLKHMEDIDIKSWLMNRDVYAKDVQKICSDTYKALSIAISLFESFISKKYDMDINSLLNIKYDWQKYLNAYFNKSIDDVKGVISLFQEKIYDAVKDERLIEKYDNCISDVDTEQDYWNF